MRLLSILFILLFSQGIMAEGLEPLHVDGRYLKNSRGDIVTLHGYMAVLDPWFQAEEYTWEGFDVATCLKNKKAAIDRLLASDWKIDYVRFGLDAYWFSDDIINQSGTVDFERFKKYFEELFLPLIEYYHEKGIYTLLWLQQGTPVTIEVGDKNQELNLLMWNYICSHPRIRNNPGVMFELANEPVWINCLQGDNDETQYLFGAKRSSVFKEARDYWQPIVDMIRSKCDNIIYISGFRWQTLYSGFIDYPIKGENIGYATHSYLGSDVHKHFEKEIFPVAYMAPIIITECAWGYSDDEVFNWGKTSEVGEPLKRVVDELGNVSWNCFEPREDYYYLVNQSSQNEKAIISNDPEVCFLPMCQWWNEYSKTKIMPTSQLKAKKVSFDFFPTFLAPGEKALAKIMAEFTNGMTWNVAGDAEYIVEDERLLSVKHGVILALKEGTTKVTVKYTDGTGQVFSKQFEVTNTMNAMFPLTKDGFNPNLQMEGSFDESTATFSSQSYCMGGWSFVGGLDCSSYKYLVVQLNHKPKCWTRVRLICDSNVWSENEAWNNEKGEQGFDLNDATELVIDLQSLHKKNGEPLDLSHIYHVGIWIDGASGSVSIKRVFLSNDGVTTAAYNDIPSNIYADNKVMYQGDEVPALTFSTSLPAINGVPKLSTTASSSSRVGTYPITIERGTVTNQDATFVNGYLFVMERPKFDIQGDVTYFYLFNPSFDRNLSGWTNTNGTARWKENTWDVLSNYCEFEWTGEPIANQEVVQFPILPAGDYRLSVDCVSDANSKGLYLVAGSNAKELPGTGGINSFSLDFNVAEESQIKIGLKVENTTATWVNFDNFKLEKISSTAINSIKADDSHHAIIYNLAGQRLSKPQKGINIIDGKKVVVN